MKRQNIRILIYVFLTVLLSQLSFAQEELNGYQERAEHIVSMVLSSKNNDEFKMALDALYKAILSDKVISEQKIPEFRLALYVRVFLAIKNNHELSRDTRQALMDVLADGIVNDGIVKDNTPYIQRKNVEFLCDLVYKLKIQDLSKQCIENIEKLCMQSSRNSRNAVLLLSASGSTKADKLIHRFADSSNWNLDGMYGTGTWAATLILAQKGEIKYVKQLVKLSEKAIEANPGMLLVLFRDLPTVHDKVVVQHLHEFLKSDKLAPEWDDGATKPQFVSYYAASALSKMLRGFPVHKSYFNMEAVEDCRKWMTLQKDFTFLDAK